MLLKTVAKKQRAKIILMVLLHSLLWSLASSFMPFIISHFNSVPKHDWALMWPWLLEFVYKVTLQKIHLFTAEFPGKYY